MNTTTETAPDEQTRARKQIARLRQEIDICDNQIVDRLACRLAYVKAIGGIKSGANLAVHDPARETSQLSRLVHLARLNNIPPEQVIIPFMAIIHLSKQAQNGTKVEDKSPIVPKLCLIHKWRTCGIEVPESVVRVCPTCHSPLF